MTITNERYYWHGKLVDGPKPEIHHRDGGGEMTVTVLDAPPEGLGVRVCERCGEEFYFDPDLTAEPPPVCYADSWALRFEEAEAAVEPYTESLGAAALASEVWHTGGGCMALVVPLGTEKAEGTYTGTRFYAMVTDEDAYLPEVGQIVTVGIYDDSYDEGTEWGASLVVPDGDVGQVTAFLYQWNDRLTRIDTATADELEAWGIDPGRRFGFGRL